jgi:hypothetical protein
MRGALKTLQRRPCVVSRQVQYRQLTRQLFLPVSPEPLADRSCYQLGLLSHEIQV